MTPEARKKWAALGGASAVVLVLGFIGDWYGRTDLNDVYPSDAVSYLDVARAFGRGDFRSALNPLWNQGYPALLALIRPLFQAGPDGVWNATHVLNLALFVIGWFVFAWLVRELVVEQRGREAAARGAGTLVGFGALALFLTAQLCTDQVSRVGPDKLVAVFFFVTCALVVRLLRQPTWPLAAGLGLTLGCGYLAKSAYLPLGAVVVAAVAVALWVAHLSILRGGRVATEARSSLRFVLPTAIVFAVIVLVYGAALSHANGYPTLGESGTINYAWHVNRLQKWVHWEGGAQPGLEAWPTQRLVRYSHYDTDPPDYGKPLHPTIPVGSAPTIYEFRGPRQATYDPYFDPPYYYQGYKHFFRWRYQLVSFGKNVGHLLYSLALQPMYWALGLVALWTLRRREQRLQFRQWMHKVWPLAIIAAVGVLLYTPVHIEERYLSAFFAVLALLLLVGIAPFVHAEKPVLAILALGFALGLVHNQIGGWKDMAHGLTHKDNVKWKIGQAVRAANLPRGAEVGMISWGANLDTDWANIGEVQITSEIQSGPDEAAFVDSTPERKQAILAEFRRSGATAVLTRDKVVGELPGWQQLGSAPVWIYRFNTPAAQTTGDAQPPPRPARAVEPTPPAAFSAACCRASACESCRSTGPRCARERSSKAT